MQFDCAAVCVSASASASVCVLGEKKNKDYGSDALLAGVLSQPRWWPFSPDEDVVTNNGSLSRKETEEGRRAREEW